MAQHKTFGKLCSRFAQHYWATVLPAHSSTLGNFVQGSLRYSGCLRHWFARKQLGYYIFGSQPGDGRLYVWLTHTLWNAKYWVHTRRVGLRFQLVHTGGMGILRVWFKTPWVHTEVGGLRLFWPRTLRLGFLLIGSHERYEF